MSADNLFAETAARTSSSLVTLPPCFQGVVRSPSTTPVLSSSFTGTPLPQMRLRGTKTTMCRFLFIVKKSKSSLGEDCFFEFLNSLLDPLSEDVSVGNLFVVEDLVVGEESFDLCLRRLDRVRCVNEVGRHVHGEVCSDGSCVCFSWVC